jgi:hypothetical protein
MKSLLLILFTIISLSVSAQGINFNFTDNTTQLYNIEDIRKITFDNSDMILYLNDGSIFTIDVTTIQGNSYTETSALSKINDLEIKVYPNPVQDYLSIETTTQESIVLTIMDLNSKQIIQETFIKNKVLDISSLPTQNYIVTLKVKGITKSFKLIKQ